MVYTFLHVAGNYMGLCGNLLYQDDGLMLTTPGIIDRYRRRCDRISPGVRIGQHEIQISRRNLTFFNLVLGFIRNQLLTKPSHKEVDNS
jgi:hypothetical protein